jgi:hypothetical protein
MELDLSHWSDRYTYLLGRYYETAILMLLAKLIRPADRVVDIGAIWTWPPPMYLVEPGQPRPHASPRW